MIKLRQGRKNPHNLYLQVGDEPNDDDRCLGLMIDPDDAEMIVKGLTSPWHLEELRLNGEYYK